MHEPEDFFHWSELIIRQVNDIISSFVEEDDTSQYIDPLKGNCAFGSGYYGWAFTITGIAAKLAAKSSIDKDQMAKLLWGDWFFDEETKGFSKSPRASNKNETRGFNKYVLRPIINLYKAILDNKIDVVKKICERQEITVKESDFNSTGKDLIKLLFKWWINVADAVLDMVCT